MVMSIDAAESDGLPVDTDQSVLQLNLAKPDPLFNYMARSIVDQMGYPDRVEIRAFRCPLVNIVDRNLEHR
ncbi:hypothetical protein OFC47_26055, partial [Escherichia coli]|nr:hypothetical protein [Escherichia coli]